MDLNWKLESGHSNTLDMNIIKISICDLESIDEEIGCIDLPKYYLKSWNIDCEQYK